MDEKLILLKAAFAAFNEMDRIRDEGCWTYGSAQNLIFNAIIKSGNVEITQKDLDELKHLME